MSRVQKSLIFTTAGLWVVYTIATLFGADLVYNIFSPMTGIAAMALLISGLKHTGKYRVSALFFLYGIAAWVVSDLILFAYTYVAVDDPLLIDISDKLYLAPNYLFGLGLTAYMIVDFKRHDVFRLLIDTFLIGVTGFIFVRKLYIYGFGINTYEGTFSFSSMMYLIAVMYMLVLMFLILTIRGVFHHTRAGYLVFGALAFYNIFEMRYTYYTAGGLDAESIYIDIIYMACVCVMGYAFTDSSLKKAMETSDALMKEPLDIKKSMGMGWVCGLILLPLIVFCYALHFLTQTEFYIMLVSCLGYLIMWKTQQANELTQELLEKQKVENTRLGEWVDYQNQELRVANEQLEKASYKDPLTGLYNRKYSRLYMNQILLENAEAVFAVYSLDVNYFKPINDNYGLETGDKVLNEMGARLKDLENDRIAAFRVGGDEFLVVCKEYKNEEEPVQVAGLLQETFDRPIEIGDLVLRVSVSIGVAAYPQDAQDVEQLLKYADSARSSIKHRHSKTEYKFYDSALIEQMSKQRRLELKLQTADYDRDFKLYYQPQVDCVSEKLIGMEALIRWIDPEEGFISPGEFIPLAEEMGLMGNIGAWVNRTAMKQIKTWNEKYHRDLVVGINVSPLQLRDPAFAEKFMAEQEAQAVPSGWLDVEITEGYALNSSMSSGDIITKLKKAGLTFSVDDFGTGYASFTSMLHFIFDRIKIAKELVDDIETNRNAYVVVKVIIAMAKDLNLQTIAEGVERKEQLEILRELGCGQIQGYYFGKPLPPDQFEEQWLHEG
ncbi:MAG: bifunctional diguanylate cyclase/phosphodiesterase [Lachnospiraceae bacterium]|nr:bifunctional diguanylate cyclase/phosphodiesterase [Lachnospiraceae bacterium]